MIILNFDYETHNSDGSLKPRAIYWLGNTFISGVDRGHEDEIYEQLDCELAFL
jgi:hypothetical protein